MLPHLPPTCHRRVPHHKLANPRCILAATQIFHAMASLYANGGFNCAITLELVGQVTFRHGTPSEILQRPCDQPWWLGVRALPDDDPCCTAELQRDVIRHCPPGSICLDDPGGCRTTSACLGTSSWSTFGPRKTYNLARVCVVESAAADEVDTSAMLSTFGEWLETNKVVLEAAFGNEIDNALLFSGKDFASSTVGLAEIGTICRSSQMPAHSVNELVSTSAGRAALITTQ